MKTNQLMKIAFNSGEVEVFHKTAMGDLTQLWAVGNKIRANDNKPFANMAVFLGSSKTKDFIETCVTESGKHPVEVIGKGNTRKTWASIHLMIYAAEYLSTKFHYEVIDMFITSRILEYRDSGGDKFKAMNMAIDLHLPERDQKSNTGVFIQIAKMIKLRVNPQLDNWNFATAEDLNRRDEIEASITSFLNAGLVKNYDHLKELIDKI